MGVDTMKTTKKPAAKKPAIKKSAMKDRTPEQHAVKMKKIKAAMDRRIAEANVDRGVLVLITGNGKGKSSSGFGMVVRALGHGFKAGVVQFIKQANSCGEQLYLASREPNLQQYAMDTGFTWDTQDKTGDIAAAKKTWAHAELMLKDPSISLVLLDELTYMISYGYLDEKKIISAIKKRPKMQHVVITGRGASDALIELADTVSEIQEVKHAFKSGVKAQKGVEY
jgi:cob(I)alamin adenosyltransferase